MFSTYIHPLNNTLYANVCLFFGDVFFIPKPSHCLSFKNQKQRLNQDYCNSGLLISIFFLLSNNVYAFSTCFGSKKKEEEKEGWGIFDNNDFGKAFFGLISNSY